MTDTKTARIREPRVDVRARERQVYDQIHAAIAERRLKPGTKLTEDLLADLFKISRARVRRVLLVLAKEHIVRLEPNRGAFVAKPSVEEARNVLSARWALESEIVRLAARHATKSNISRLRTIIDEEAKAVRDKDYARSIRLAGEFHIELSNSTGNPIMTEFITVLMLRCYLILATYQRRDHHSTCPQDDHKKLVDYIENRDEDGANEAMRRHFNHMESELDFGEEEDELSLSDILMGV